MAKAEKKSAKKSSSKIDDLSVNTENGAGQLLTTNQGLKINDNNNSLKAGERGPTLLEDFILREKTTHFDHERIPERIVHARGSGAHGIFKLYESLDKYTKAAFLNDTKTETPVFVRFSTVAGSRGSSDLARDVRGFAVKFYTSEGNYDLVGNNMPVFFIQDAMKFPDLVHAVKPEPHNEMPQAASAHDTFWDFISLMPESMHMVMWQMSDRAIPRSFRMMEGFGVHTFRLINAKNESSFVKFHWKPLLGVHSVVWDEAQNISGKDPDFHRRDLWESIEAGNFPEWELGLQIIPEADEFKYEFDLLDPTKLIPVMRVGKMTLNRNPDNFFAETEPVADGVKDVSLNKMKKALNDNGAMVKLISKEQGIITTEGGKKITVDGGFLTDASVLYDAIFIPDGKKNIAALLTEPKSIHFVNETYKHCKAIATGADGAPFLKEAIVQEIELKKLNMEKAGVITDGNADKFIGCIANHRFWNREESRKVPA